MKVERLTEFIGKAKKLSLTELARAAHLHNEDISPVDNYLFFTSYITRWSASENGNFYVLMELTDIFYTELKDRKKYRFVEYNYLTDKAKLVNGIIENAMDREPFDYIMIIDAESFIEDEVLKIINKEKTEVN